ncbi:helix-turn-helix transcriptional regulator [Alicyclobacillus fastidiosus]|uniref:Helix-turn-helix transcriptional regulator n=1 Tax=Alicyclobacillus fastidiosus TaxID=392011 RepID=A0ABY6ZEW6_9BACL|nr:helix-turn-helix transcriptional regulator [Alicyclobacillus fastidiosus]WAH41445.1 helix-turn-helix transcriptional regulator [Alicyclobacillus fastidiosus]GMA63078.1 transcriptional regulator [Alicyclobacillus fastidiosus]
MVKNIIKELRNEFGITQSQFAKDLQITRQTVIAIENGKYNPSLELSLKISRYFGRRIEDIFELVEGIKE